MKEKVLGEKDNCSFCKCVVVCGSTTYQGETKLQWQNPDGKAHYKPNKAGCNVYGQAATPGFAEVTAPSGGTSSGSQTVNLESNIPKAPMNKTIDEAFNIVLASLSAVDNYMPTLYPKLDKNSNVYGQIRSKLSEDILTVYCALINKPKE